MLFPIIFPRKLTRKSAQNLALRAGPGRPTRLAAGSRASRSLTASSRRYGPVVAAVVLPAGDPDPAVCSQQGCDGFPLLPTDLQRQRTTGAERSLVVFREAR